MSLLESPYQDLSMRLLPSPVENRHPIKEQTSYPRIIANTLGAPALLGIGILMGQQISQAAPNYQVIRACSLSIGIIERILLKANLPKEAMEVVHNAFASWAWESFLILWQAHENITNPLAKEVIINVILGKAGLDITGDILTAFELRKGDRTYHSPANLNLNGERLNPLFLPAFNDAKGQAICNTALGVVGVALTLFGYLGNSQNFNVLFKTFGAFLIGQGPGVWVMWKIFEELKREEKTDNEAVDFSHEPRISRKKRTFRLIVNMAPSLAADLISALSLLNRPELYFGVGFIYGLNQYVRQRDFETLTVGVHEARKSANLKGRDGLGRKILKTAFKVNIVTSISMFLLAFGWFGGDGLTNSSGKDENISIIVFMSAMLVTIVSGMVQEKLFSPEKNGRALNTLRYLIHHNFLLFAVFYQALTQISAINDRALALDSESAEICGDTGLGLYAVSWIGNRIRDMSVTAPTPSFAAPAYIMEMVKTIWEYLSGEQ